MALLHSNFADRILVASMFGEAGNGDQQVGADTVRKWTIELQRLITQFHAQTVQEVFSSYGLIGTPEEMELRDKFCANPGSVCIPLTTFEPQDFSV
jgi:hypothetical protein